MHCHCVLLSNDHEPVDLLGSLVVIIETILWYPERADPQNAECLRSGTFRAVHSKAVHSLLSTKYTKYYECCIFLVFL
jgi:hypothetical protein